MLTANWGIAAWADNPEMPPTRWDTLEVIPPDERESWPALAARIARVAAEQERELLEASYARRWPHRGWGQPA